MKDEKRRFTRVPFRVKTKVAAKNVIFSAEEITNLSVGGCLLPIEAELEPETECRLEILLSGTATELSVQVEGKIVRCESGTMAIRFTRIEPDSLFHLQNIIRYNYPDTDKVEHELGKHPGLI
jgi:hypothetical protein